MYRRWHCGMMAVEAIEMLKKKDCKAHRMEQGVPDWSARGWRVATAREVAR